MAVVICKFLAPQRLYCAWLLLVWAVFFIHSTLPVGMAQILSPSTDLADHSESGICKSIDIRNSIDMFEELRGCRVVEGYVQILLFDKVNSYHFANLSFPELTEITDYLLLYRVSGLLSVGQLFPNLVVIRGYQLLFGYAFVVFEMPSLQEINLYSLTDIMSGSIRIDKNPSLCFVNTIDWSLITHVKSGHFIKSVRMDNECPLCPGEDGTGDNGNNCPIASYSTKEHTKTRRLCWNNDRCQKVCKGNCRACDATGICCDDKCLGGCSVNDSSNCEVCRNFVMGRKENRTCFTNCPKDMLEYLGRKCVTRDECISFKDNRVREEFPYRVFNQSCVLECPKDYVYNATDRNCIPCEGRCEKICSGKSIDNMASIQQLSGCTHINGSLEIQIRGGGQNIVHYLEENLKLIKEIDGYLKIVRSFPLISLSFLKNLEKINGNVLENGRYVISVFDNQNLQDIWDWENRKLTVGNGSLFFHFNPKLCPDKITTLRQKANLVAFNEHEVSSNGDKVACNVTNFAVTIDNITSHEALLKWKKFEIIDSRKLLAFQIFFTEAPFQNISLYDNRDACGDDGWTIVDVPIPDTYMNISHMNRTLLGLKPYTQYAFYIKTYTIATERDGGQSPIQYFRTDADEPAPPPKSGVYVISNSSDSLKISWEPTKEPNGNITSYRVTLIVNEAPKLLSMHQNHCERHPHPTIKPLIDPSKLPPPKPNQTCECRGKPKSGVGGAQEQERSSQISFEDELINQVYIKRPDQEKREKREAKYSDKDIKNANSNETLSKNVSTNGKYNYNTSIYTVEGSLELYVDKLLHYTDYSISIQACREKIPGNTLPECSIPTNTTYRTLKKDDADMITSGIKVYHTNQTAVTLTWRPPSNPNGNILYYLIEYKRLDIENPYNQCVNHADFEGNRYLYSLYGLNAGNYSVRVLAVSEAKADRKFSSPVHFIIEESTNNDIMIIFGSLFGTIVAVIILFIIYKKYVPKPDIKLITTVNPEYVSTAYEPDDWEVPRRNIELHKELGQGSFGMVYEGLAKDIKGRSEVRCAIKTVNEHATNRERIEFLNEASVMKAFDTVHVVKLLGVVSQGQPTLVIMELMANGDLKTYLRSHRPEAHNYSTGRQPPSLKRILQMAIEIADGMAYLAAMKYVHRDLAARNCMVSEDLTVKIGDFGMTRDIYETDYYRKGTKGLLPVRWMAPESLKDGVFSSSSDVWSYGVVLWEMATLASQPYQGRSNEEVLRYVIGGGIMERPENCPDKLYTLMVYCWNHKFAERPSFLELCAILLDDSGNQFAMSSFYHSAAGLEARLSRNNQFVPQDDVTTPLRLANELEEHFSLNSSGSESDPEDELVGNSRLEFSSYPIRKNNSTVNGYLGANTSNGTTA